MFASKSKFFLFIFGGVLMFCVLPLSGVRAGKSKTINFGTAIDTISIPGKMGINNSAPTSTVNLQINASTSTEGLRIVSASNYSPLNIRNSSDNADIFRVDQNGSLAVGSVPWGQLTNFPGVCPDGQYVTAVAKNLTCSVPPSGGVSGSGTANYITKWSATSAIGNSVIYDNGTKVGIGTSSPIEFLNVYKNAVGNTNIRVENPDTGVSTAGFNFVANGGQLNFLQTNGNAAWNQVRYGQNAGIFEETGAGGVQFNAFNNASTATIRFVTGATTPTEKMRIANNGNVGIGTTAPAGLLNVAKAAGDNLIYADNYSTTGGNSNYWFSRRSHSNTNGTLATTLTGDNIGTFYFQGVNTSNAFAYGAKIVAQQNGSAGTYIPTDLNLSTYSATAQNLNQLFLSTNGNVGIGTPAALSKLTVNGDAILANGLFYIDINGNVMASSMSDMDNIAYYLDPSNATTSINVAGSIIGTSLNLGSDGFAIMHEIDLIADDAEQAGKICLNGNCITSWPGGSITGSGTSNRITKWTGASAIGNSLISDNGSAVSLGTTSTAYLLNVGGDIGATSFIYTSDRNLKKNIKTLDGSLEKIMALRGVSFDWKSDGRPSIGLIAQEVESVFPELVSNSGGIRGVQYGNLVAPLIEAVKEQQAEIQGQKAVIESQQEKLDSLNGRLLILENKLNLYGSRR